MPTRRAAVAALSAANSLVSAGSVCPNGVAQAVPVASFLPLVSLALWPAWLPNVCRSPPPRSRLPVGVTANRPHGVKAVQEAWEGRGGTLVLALTGVVDWLPHTGGSFTHAHLVSSFPHSDS
jgi:hypothetical protein